MPQRLMVQKRRHSEGLANAGEPTVRIRLLGGFEVSVGTRLIEANGWRLKKAGSLVKLLALTRGHRLHRDLIMNLLWPDLGATSAANNLHRTLHVARKTLDPHAPASSTRYLRLTDQQIELCRGGTVWVDAVVFEQAAAAAVRTRYPAAHTAAADLYAGDLLPGDLYEPWAEERRTSLRQAYLSLLLGRAELHEESGDQTAAIEALRRAVDEDRGNEEVHAGLMRLLAIAGQPHEAIRQYERLRQALSTQLDTKPGDTTETLRQEIIDGDPLSGHTLRASRGPDVGESPQADTLPIPLTSFVGRERETLEIKRSLSMTRLLTLTGPGGAGKTRLAMQLATDLVGTYSQGVWLVELAPLSDPTLVVRTVAAALGIRERPGSSLTHTLCESLGSGRALIVLDNCEHLIGAAAQLTRDLLISCPKLKVLATSREPLGVVGEAVWPVPSLSLPDPEWDSSVAGLMRCEAACLFMDRARSRLPAFELTSQNAPSVATICRELEGLPLAIELSTARMGALAVEQVAERLEDSLKLLTGGDRTAAPRHQTLRATLDWSYALLSGPERKLFESLSVFAGGWTLEAAEAVGTGGELEVGELVDLLPRLANKSMVVVEAKLDPSGELRYTMLEPVRQYGWGRLEASGEAGVVRRRHADWYFELAKGAEPWLRGAWLGAWRGRLELEYGNLRAALEWAFENGESDLGLWFGGALAEFWYMSGNLSEARRWLEAALDRSLDAPPTPTRARALARAGWIAWEQGDYERSLDLSEQSLAFSRELGDTAGIVAALSSRGWVALLNNDLAEASVLAEDALALARETGDSGAIARALVIPGLAAVASRDHERAVALHEESLSLARVARDNTTIALAFGLGAFAYLGCDDLWRAQELCEEGFLASPQPPVMVVTGFLLHASAAVAGSQGHPARAARLWGAAESLRETIGAILSPLELHTYGPYVDSARAKDDATAWEECWAEGKAMSSKQAVAYALAGSEDEGYTAPRGDLSQDPQAGRQPEGTLTGREQEVAALTAHGLTNRRIAEELSISVRTVDTHVGKILKKLGLDSREQVAV